MSKKPTAKQMEMVRERVFTDYGGRRESPEYMVVWIDENDGVSVAGEVRAFIRRGWRPLGGPFTTRPHAYGQAMTRGRLARFLFGNRRSLSA